MRTYVSVRKSGQCGFIVKLADSIASAAMAVSYAMDHARGLDRPDEWSAVPTHFDGANTTYRVERRTRRKMGAVA